MSPLKWRNQIGRGRRETGQGPLRAAAAGKAETYSELGTGGALAGVRGRSEPAVARFRDAKSQGVPEAGSGFIACGFPLEAVNRDRFSTTAEKKRPRKRRNTAGPDTGAVFPLGRVFQSAP
jgi:hypothetical protein